MKSVRNIVKRKTHLTKTTQRSFTELVWEQYIGVRRNQKTMQYVKEKKI